ncbi:hypothetical protein FRC00_003551 [Tulasnella sp. 408]|nr:hypothetical protein FRC00_003551 [Tulasnella sp. 408]
MHQQFKTRKRQIQKSIAARSTVAASISSSTLSADSSSSATRVVQISTTVGNDTEVHTVPLKRLNETDAENVTSGSHDISGCAPDSLGGSESETEFEEDFVLVEDAPTCIQTLIPCIVFLSHIQPADDDYAAEDTPSSDWGAEESRFPKKGARWRREKLRSRSCRFLARFYALESGPDPLSSPGCESCFGSHQLYQCLDCVHAPFICGSCMIDVHRRLPFHRLQFWSVQENGDGAWETTSLASIGFVLHTGHKGFQCTRAVNESVRVVQVLDINGQHSIPMLFCQCQENYEDQGDQLFRLRLYPASDDVPQTAFTFRLMKHFLLCQLEMCCSAARYYDMLALQTGSVNTRFLKVWRVQFNLTEEWKVIEAFMTANSKTGLDLKPGEGTVECGFCPIPGVNIPDTWRADPEAELLYTVFEAFDGNFSLQLNNKGVSEVVDPSIIGDAGYWVQQAESTQYITALASEDLTAPSGSENMAAKGLDTVFVTYDIWCKYSINLEKRLAAGGMLSFSDLGLKVMGGIPKFHIGGHGAGCFPKYSLDFMPNVGRTHGERVEQAWADLGRAKYITREMTPGHRKDTLHLFFSHRNWKMLCNDDQRLQREIIHARRQIRQRQDDLQELEESLGPSLLKEFQDWDREHPEIDKYSSHYSDLKSASRAEILRRLYVKEAANEGGTKSGPNQSQQLEPASSAVVFVSAAIDLEAQRFRLEEKALLANESGNKEAVSDWITAENRFKSSLTRHYAQLALFAPLLSGCNFTVPPTKLIHTAKLYFPSEFSDDDRTRYRLEILSDLESSLRIPLAQEEIIHLRDALGIKAFLIREGRQTGKSGLTGTASLTRSQSRLRQAQIRIERVAARYRHHFAALKELGTSLGIGTEAGALQDLIQSDLEITSTWTENDINFSRGGRRPTVGSSFKTVPWFWKCFGPGLVSQYDTEDVVAQKIDQFNRRGEENSSKVGGT